MAVLTNTMMQGTAAISDEESYQIEKSLRFEEADSATLTKTFGGTGNRKTWTFATWVKFTGDSNQADLWHARDASGSPWTTFYLDSDFRLGITWTAGVNSNDFTPNRVYKDYSAWLHVVLAFDTTQSVESDRIKMYTNGELETEFAGTVYYPTLNQEVPYMNTNVEHGIGGPGSKASFYLADTQFIDGLALSPAAFGKFDSTGCWNPKAYALPAPNKGTTWSSSLTAQNGFYNSGGTSYPATNLFDGSLTTIASDAQAQSHITFAPSGGISYNQSVRVYQINGDGSDKNDSTFTLTDADGTVRTTKVADHSGKWTTVHLGSGKFTSLKAQADAAADTWNYWAAIEVDGVILRDGRTDFTTSNNPHDGTIWSNHTTANNGFAGSTPATKGFNGNLDANDHLQGDHTANSRVTFDVPGDGLPFHTLRIFGGKDAALSDANALL